MSKRVSLLQEEFINASLGHSSRVTRLLDIVTSLADEPAASFPQAAWDDASLEATYRFLGNDAVSAEGILSGHYERTVERAAGLSSVLAIHDSSNFEFGGQVPRKGLGHLRGKGQGFIGHISLLVAPGEERRPLGVLSLKTTFRTGPARGKRTARELREDPAKESKRWFEGVETVEARLNGCTGAIHVMDREGDSYELFAQLLSAKRRFVIRAAHDRTLSPSERAIGRDTLWEALTESPPVIERTVQLSTRRKARTPSGRKIHPPRKGRLARLVLSAQRIELPRSRHVRKDLPKTISVNVVQVREIEIHSDEEPIDWLLITTEPIGTVEEVERIVDIYRARWTIEEYFKALKTGCSYEKRQLESRHTLLNALAVFIPIAWQLFLLRTLARVDEGAPASEVLSQSQIDVLLATARRPMSSQPTAREAFLAIAARGGHLKRNGEPGWQVLWRGFQRLLLLEAGWLAAQGVKI